MCSSGLNPFIIYFTQTLNVRELGFSYQTVLLQVCALVMSSRLMAFSTMYVLINLIFIHSVQTSSFNLTLHLAFSRHYKINMSISELILLPSYFSLSK